MIYIICQKCGDKVSLSDSEFYELVRKEVTALLCQIETLTDTNKRLGDLVRHQRSELHDAELITDEEYAALAEDHAAVARLEGYDALRAKLGAVEKLEETFKVYQQRFEAMEEKRKSFEPQVLHLVEEGIMKGYDLGTEAAFKYLNSRGLVSMDLLDEWKSQRPKGPPN
jgi:hypothetical protein